MAIMDKLTEFCNAQSVALAAGTHLLGDVIDIQDTRDIGNSGSIFFQMRAASNIITAGTAGTIEFQLVSDAQAAIATNGTATVHWRSGQYTTGSAATSQLKMGDVIAQLQLPMESAYRTYERYVGVLAVVGTTPVTNGSVDAYMTLDPTSWKALPDAVN